MLTRYVVVIVGMVVVIKLKRVKSSNNYNGFYEYEAFRFIIALVGPPPHPPLKVLLRDNFAF